MVNLYKSSLVQNHLVSSLNLIAIFYIFYSEPEECFECDVREWPSIQKTQVDYSSIPIGIYTSVFILGTGGKKESY